MQGIEMEKAPASALYKVRESSSAGWLMHSFVEVQIDALGPEQEFYLDVGRLGRSRLAHISVQSTTLGHAATWDGDLIKPKIWFERHPDCGCESFKIIVEVWGR